MTKRRPHADDLHTWLLVRPPILRATAALGLPDAEVARRLGVHPVQVSDWATGKRPIPRLRHVALRLVVAFQINRARSAPADIVSSDRDATRFLMSLGNAIKWLDLSEQEDGPSTEEEALAAVGILFPTLAQDFENDSAAEQGRQARDVNALIVARAGDETLNEHLRNLEHNLRQAKKQILRRGEQISDAELDAAFAALSELHDKAQQIAAKPSEAKDSAS
jgi:DNA-binding transcriptional regulator YdaS (Cro superfamily)